jgi:hypothetical protein
MPRDHRIYLPVHFACASPFSIQTVLLLLSDQFAKVAQTSFFPFANGGYAVQNCFIDAQPAASCLGAVSFSSGCFGSR